MKKVKYIVFLFLVSIMAFCLMTTASAEVVTVKDGVDVVVPSGYLTYDQTLQLIVFIDDKIDIGGEIGNEEILWISHTNNGEFKEAELRADENGFLINDVFNAIKEVKPHVVRRYYLPRQVEEIFGLLGYNITIHCVENGWAQVEENGSSIAYIPYKIDEYYHDKLIDDTSLYVLLQLRIGMDKAQYDEEIVQESDNEAEPCMNFEEILDFFDIIRPDGANVTKIREKDGYKVTFYAEDYVAVIIGENGLYPRITVLTAIQNTPKVFGKVWYPVSGIPNFLKQSWEIENASVEIAENECTLNIDENKYTLLSEEREEGSYVNEIDLYKAIFEYIDSTSAK